MRVIKPVKLCCILRARESLQTALEMANIELEISASEFFFLETSFGVSAAISLVSEYLASNKN